MFEEFFDKCELHDPEIISASQSEKIKSALQKKVADNSQHTQTTKEEKPMKTKTIRTFIIAAVAAVVGTVSIIGAASTMYNRDEVVNDLAEQNVPNEAFFDRVGDYEGVPMFTEMKIGKYIVTNEDFGRISEQNLNDMPGKNGIWAIHEDETYATAASVDPDGNGGYTYYGKPVEDEQLLAAIEEGLAKYGDHFFIWY